MKTIGYEVQHPDFSSEEAGQMDIEEAVSRLRSHPWAQELARFEDLLKQEQDACPPNVILAQGETSLQVQADEPGSFIVTGFTPARKKFLWFSYNGTREVTKTGLSLEAAVDLAKQFPEAFFGQDRAQ